MRNTIFVICVLFTLQALSQENTSMYDIKFDQIRSIAHELNDQKNGPIYADSAYNYFLNRDYEILEYLLAKISDTSYTQIERTSTGGFYKKGDLAIIILGNLVAIPYSTLTNNQQYCFLETGYLPLGFLSELDKDRSSVQQKMKEYFATTKKKKIWRHWVSAQHRNK